MAARKSAAAVAPAAPPLPLLTADEVQQAKAACRNFQRLYRAQKAAERDRDAALAQMFFKMGFDSLDQVKSMSPERLTAEITKRTGVAFAFASDDAASFAILKTWNGHSVSWKEQFIAQCGPAAAADAEKSARMQYSYAVVDLPTEPAPNVIHLPARIRK